MLVKIFIILIIFISGLASSDETGANNTKLPILGDRVSGAVSAAQEKAIGEMFLKQVYSQAPLISDPIIFDYTEHLIYRLSEYSQVEDRYFSILLIVYMGLGHRCLHFTLLPLRHRPDKRKN